MEEKTYVSKPKAFSVMGYILLIFGILYIVSAIGDQDFQVVKEAVTGGFISICVAILLVYLGSKKRTIKVNKEGMEYISGKIKYSAAWNEIEMLSTENEKNKTTKTVFIVKSEEDIFYLTTAFFNYFLLKEAFIHMAQSLKENNPEAEISDEAGWLGDAPATSPSNP